MTDATDASHGNAGVALLFCAGAGLATLFGGTVVFSKRLVHLANPVSLAIALSVSAGVMIFISLVELLAKSVDSLTAGFTAHGYAPKTAAGHAWSTATLCFGAGIVLIYAVDRVVMGISRVMVKTSEPEGALSGGHLHHNHFFAIDDPNSNAVVMLEADALDAHTVKLARETHQQLVRMGLLSVLALGLHNIPEGIATYAGAIEDSTVGFSLAVGIGIHNIPEGIAVAAPIYFATGSRSKGLMWCAVSAVAEPLGGVFAWAVVGDGMDPIPEGILFGFVCGIMVCICVKELWPTAYRFSGGHTHYVALGTFAGMFIMVTSLILFRYAGV